MTLGEIIDTLKKFPPETSVPIGFGYPHSYRGSYADLAFEPEADTTVGEMLAAAESALGTTFEGWKGGEFTMEDFTDCWLAYQGESGEMIGPLLLAYMLGCPELPKSDW